MPVCLDSEAKTRIFDDYQNTNETQFDGPSKHPSSNLLPHGVYFLPFQGVVARDKGTSTKDSDGGTSELLGGITDTFDPRRFC